MAYTISMSITIPIRDQRLAIRLTAWQKSTIERAASIAGGSVTDFAVHAMVDRAQEVLADQPVFEVDRQTWEEFNRLLDAPATPVPGMTDLLARPTVFDE